MSGTISLKWAVTLVAGLIVAVAVLVASMGGGGEEASSSGYSAEEQAAYDDAAEWCERSDVQERAGTTLESQLLLARSYAEVANPGAAAGVLSAARYGCLDALPPLAE